MEGLLWGTIVVQQTSEMCHLSQCLFLSLSARGSLSQGALAIMATTPIAQLVEVTAAAPTATHRLYFCYVRYRANTYSIELHNPNTTFRELKVLIAAHPDIGLPVAQQAILRQGAEMQDHQLVSNTSTVLQVVPRRDTTAPPAVAPGHWQRPSFQPLPLISHDLPAIPQDVFTANTFFVWCTARTTPCFSEAMVPIGESHNPRCASPDECAALDRHVSIGRDSTGIEYPQELQPANAKPRCSRCKSEWVLIDQDQPIQWQAVLSGSMRGECFQCERVTSIELVFVCRGDLAQSINTSDGIRRTVCRSYAAHPLPNVFRQPPESALLQQAVLMLQQVANRARTAMYSAITKHDCLSDLQLLWSSISADIRSIGHCGLPAVSSAIEAANVVANKTRDLSTAKELNPTVVLDRQHDAIVQLTSAVDQCGRVETLIERQLSLSLDTGRPDLIQLEFHGCVGDRPHRINANGIRRYIASQPTMRSALARNNRCPEVFGEFVVRCCEPGCPGIVYLPSCRLADDGAHATIRNWRSSEEALSRGAILCPLGGCRCRGPFVPDTAGPCVQCRWCQIKFCEEHQMAWSSCPHTSSSEESIRARIDEVLNEGCRQRCPQCQEPFQNLSNPLMHMACTNCGQRWCYSCGRHTTDPHGHNDGWEEDPEAKCPRLITEHPRFQSTSATRSLALLHRSKVLELLLRARTEFQLHHSSVELFDFVFRTYPQRAFTFEYNDGEVRRSSTPSITISDLFEPLAVRSTSTSSSTTSAAIRVL